MMELPELPPLPPYLYGRELAPNERVLSLEACKEYARSYALQAVAQERADKERILALQKASYEREITLEVEAERERCAKICETLPRPFARDIERDDFAEAIRNQGKPTLQRLLDETPDGV